MAAITCSLCGRSEEVPKWHPEYEALVDGDPTALRTHVCQSCRDRVQAEALGERERERRPPGG
jgi:uncharacterized protein YlaI